MNKNDGGPAFPCDRDYPQAVKVAMVQAGMLPNRGGMSLRDWFAGMAMSGWLASFGEDAPLKEEDEVANLAYRVADSMLEKRERE